MQREIKFKALAEHHDGTKEWFYYTTRTGKILTEMYVNNKIKRWIVEDLQYTGYKDRHDQEIYAGDVIFHLKWHHSPDLNQKGNRCFVEFDESYRLFPSQVSLAHVSINKIGELIGNKYENPELLTL